ncbi:BamA/TamA family outer membrane protein [Humisphaera borealis]|uniref:BamA/TamA family outer membrane protein n=1 Tax=Humisphaera borealis TaxID=2807512 RepID=A0A7M2WUU7_9BACT|nr:BamA/TamA family outer membrane protein [Humisphaera borealis]QOV89307.1 BamA/TamA family outer membrane protein [Humisphaera borealis]
MKRFIPLRVILSIAFVALTSARAGGQSVIRPGGDRTEPENRSLILPFAFYTSATDLAVGVGGAVSGIGQPQQFLGAAAFGSTNGSVGLYVLQRDLQLNPIDRLFLDSKLFFTRYSESEEYVDGNALFPGRAGDNDSAQDDYVIAETVSGQLEANFKYILPIGHGRGNPIATYTLERGQLKEGATGGTSWNPFESGRTIVELTPFSYWRRLSADNLPEDNFDSFGVKTGIKWENTDFPMNPTRGNTAKAYLARDFGIFSSRSAYTAMELGYAHYFDLGRNSTFRQVVLAVDGWSSTELSGDAPYYTGATLGGYERMRGYPFYRFNGRAAVYGGAELRMTLDWNPLRDIDIVDKVAEIDWIQFTVFGEVGRVADSFSGELFSDPKWDAGIGIRVLARQIVLRADLAVGEEGVNMWLMVGHSF